MEQYTFDGRLVEVKGPEKQEKQKKYINMQKRWGIFGAEKKCYQCKYFIQSDYRDRRYFKCELRGVSHSTASDIRKYADACGRFIEDTKDYVWTISKDKSGKFAGEWKEEKK